MIKQTNPPMIIATHENNSQELIESQSHSNRARHTENNFSRCFSFENADVLNVDDVSSDLMKLMYSQESRDHTLKPICYKY